MTPDRALRNDILAGAKSAKKARTAKPRKEKKQRSIWVTLLIRTTIMVVGLLAARVLLYTEPGQALMTKAQDAVADLIAAEMAARATGDDAAIATTTGSEDSVSVAPGAKRIMVDEANDAQGVRVNAMPESRVTIRRVGE